MIIELGGNHYRRVPQLCDNDCRFCSAFESTCFQGCQGCAASRDKPVCDAIKAAYGRPCGYHMWEATQTTGVPQSAEQVGFGF